MGQTIRNVMGEGDFFNLYEFFLNFFASVDNFLKIQSLAHFCLFKPIIFPFDKSLHELFFSNFPGVQFFLSVSPARILFLLPPPPITFLMVRP